MKNPPTKKRARDWYVPKGHKKIGNGIYPLTWQRCAVNPMEPVFREIEKLHKANPKVEYRLQVKVVEQLTPSKRRRKV